MTKLDWRCPICGSGNMSFMVNLTIASPMKHYHNLGKNVLRSKDIVIWGASWPTGDITCKDCGWWLAHRPRHPNLYLLSALMLIGQQTTLEGAQSIAAQALDETGNQSVYDDDDEIAPFGWIPS